MKPLTDLDMSDEEMKMASMAGAQL